MSSKPTPGPWFADDEGEVYRLIGDDRDFLFSTTGHQDDLANGTLAAEAGTVHHATGLTPQQLREQLEVEKSANGAALAELRLLREQRDELLAALKWALSDIDDTARYSRLDERNECRKRASAAISKVEGRS